MNIYSLRSELRGRGVQGFCEQLNIAFRLQRQGKPGGLSASEFRTDELAEAIFGHETVRLVKQGALLSESAAAVDVTAFRNITGQLLFSEVMRKYEQESFVLSALFPTKPTRFLTPELVPGIEGLKEEVEEVKPQMPYPSIGFGEDYQEKPRPIKRGFIVPVSREAIFADITGRILEVAGSGAETMAVNREKRFASLLIGATNNYKRKGTAHNTYQTSTPWINKHQNVLEDFSDIDNAENLFAELLDPNTNEPIVLDATTIVVPWQAGSNASKVLNATEIRRTTNTSTVTIGPPDNAKSYKLVRSKQLYRRLIAAAADRIPGGALNATQAKQNWFLLDPMKAFSLRQAWPIQTKVAPINSEAEFNQDISARYRVDSCEVETVEEPRATVHNTH